jgi:hypothetical protein
MTHIASISGHLINIKERVFGMKEVILDCNYSKQPLTVENIKTAYQNRFGKELKGRCIGHWISIPDRGAHWTFRNEIEFHPSCNHLEFKYSSEIDDVGGGRRWSRYFFI